MRPTPNTLGPVVERIGLSVSFCAWAAVRPTKVITTKKARANMVDLPVGDKALFMKRYYLRI
jgi:hypothetical protein